MIFSGLLTYIKDSGKNLQVRYMKKTKNNIANVSPYGFWSNPPQNSKVLVFRDSTSGYFGIAYLDSVEPVLKSTEVASGNSVVGSILKFDESGNIDITAGSGYNITINGTNINLGTTVIVAGGTNKVLTDATVIHDSSGNPCTVISGASDNLKTT